MREQYDCVKPTPYLLQTLKHKSHITQYSTYVALFIK